MPGPYPYRTGQASSIARTQVLVKWYEEMMRICPNPTYAYSEDANSGRATYTLLNEKQECIGTMSVAIRTK